MEFKFLRDVPGLRTNNLFYRFNTLVFLSVISTIHRVIIRAGDRVTCGMNCPVICIMVDNVAK